ncbi:Cysteinyl-tRNA synthetase [Lactobacillus salivarius UCC118] [Dolosigranulum pigrum]|uniref:cysteine--tRNA ligase n=1 Tax=Dolosigranulum pigrum TaxID=29394 RepID=UPI000DC0236A|nr:cysteine--tRNA ligase [Dolosigranulum pigrum]RAN57022.1 cysteine--tRNA ligase [Dolosigranulum pigrum]VTU64370.1 Cysteinyl-tRNA synthetase [Lactobacillus salivarius UCC118] [Dolosigranulum pigrum]
MVKVYNTLSRQLEEFVPIEPGKVRMYVCGPTVYNYIHIGNARAAVAFDTIRKYLEFRGYAVRYVSNFTDVDDKILRAAREAGEEPRTLAERFIQAYHDDTGALNVAQADVHPTVTDNIDEIIAFNEALIEREYAYESGGDVYFKTREFESYGKLSRISVDELLAGASERLDEANSQLKEDPLDFALWKTAKDGELSWDSPWGKGRPGWHIECSVMATRELGDTIDIHAGGQDLQFPHHENEIAQTEAKTGQSFANYWLHNGFVTMDSEKMSKSLGNFKLLRDLLEHFDGQVLRFLLATAHYRKPINYSEAAIEEAQVNLQKIQTAYENAEYRLRSAVDVSGQLPDDRQVLDEWQVFLDSFNTHMDMDFQAQNGISDIYDMVRFLNRYMNQDTVSGAVLDQLLADLKERLYIFGIEDLTSEQTLLDEDIRDLIDEREQAREDKNYARADEIRDQLSEQGIILEDTAQGVRFKRVNTDGE